MMKKRRIGKKLLVMAALLLFSVFTMAVCAEDGGYWTTCTDSEGRVVRVFTYTEPVEYTFGEWDPDQPLDQPDEPGQPAEPDEPVAGADQAPLRLAAPEDGQAAGAAAAAPSNPLAGVAALGVVMLAVLAAALYKAV